MRYLVVSDSHGDREILVDLAETYQGKVDKFFHCGDSELSDTDELWKVFSVVKGNCDYESDFPESVTEQTVLDTVYMVHGHLLNVGFTLDKLFLQGKKVQANILLFGHTHQVGCEMNQNIMYLNSGSISFPRGAITIPTYVLIDSTDEKLTVTYLNRNHQKLNDLSTFFIKQ